MKTTTFMILLLFLAGFCFAMSGSGTPGNPYLVTTCTELQSMSASPAASYALANDADCSDTVNWNDDGSGNKQGFVPIQQTACSTPACTSQSSCQGACGNYCIDPSCTSESDCNMVCRSSWHSSSWRVVPFSGTFDGQNHVITGLYINRPSQDRVGLFAYANGASISNVGLVDANILGGSSVGSFIGYNPGTVSISNSYCIGNVTGAGNDPSRSGNYVGGLIGNSYSGNVSNSHFIGNVAGIGTDVGNSGTYVGGLIGNSWHGNVSNSYSTGSVNGVYFTGGLIGLAQGNNAISNSYSTASVTSVVYPGGLIGDSMNSNIFNSSSTGNVNGTGNYGYVGGLLGSSYYDDISGSHSTGNVTGNQYVGGFAGETYSSNVSNSYSTGNVTGNQYVGGFSGQSGVDSISNSYSTGSVTGHNYVGGFIGSSGYSTVSNSYSTGNASGNSYVGGLVARGYYARISNSYSTGNVTGTDNYVGGLTGESEYDVISNSHSTGDVKGRSFIGGLIGNARNSVTVSNSYSSGNVNAQSYVGGLIGYNRYSTVSDSFSTGSVSGSDSVGGLIGKDGGTITDSYWDICRSGQSDCTGNAGTPFDCTGVNGDCEDNGYFYSKGNPPMNNTWDFTTIWQENEGDYPTLQPAAAPQPPQCPPDCPPPQPQCPAAMLGSGTPADPCMVTNCTQLQAINENLTLSYALNNSVDCSDTRAWNPDGSGGYHGFVPIKQELYDYCSNPSCTDPASCQECGHCANSSCNELSCESTTGYCGDNPYCNAPDCCGDWHSGCSSTWVTGCCSYWNHAAVPFSGTFDGNNHTITGLYINRTSEDYIGLFGVTSGAAIKNVGLINANVSGRSTVGGLIGSTAAVAATISNSYATGTVTGAGDSVGGLIGSNSWSSYIAMSEGAAVGGVHANVTVAGSNYVGGLIGIGAATNCYATGNVVGSDNVGGLIGLGTASNSYATGKVAGRDDVGGLIGTGSKISNSYAAGNVTGTGTRVGGLVGNLEYPFESVSNSYAIGSVTGSDAVGGLIGYGARTRGGTTISYSYATGPVTGAGSNVGGLIGQLVEGTVIGSYWDVCRTNQCGCAGGNPDMAGCYPKNYKGYPNVNYFYNYSYAPASGWGSPPWDTVCSSIGYPTLGLQHASSGDCMRSAAPQCGLDACGPPLPPQPFTVTYVPPTPDDGASVPIAVITVNVNMNAASCTLFYSTGSCYGYGYGYDGQERSVQMAVDNSGNAATASAAITALGTYAYFVTCNGYGYNPENPSDSTECRTVTILASGAVLPPSAPAPLEISASSSCAGNVVTVTSNGRPVADARVSIGDFAYRTGQDGTATFSGCGNTIAIHASKDGYRAADSTETLVPCAQCAVPVQPPVTPPTPPGCKAPACCGSDTDCADNSRCTKEAGAATGKCVQITGCGLVSNHKLTPWQCGGVGCPECAQGSSCANHVCVKANVTQPPLVKPPVVDIPQITQAVSDNTLPVLIILLLLGAAVLLFVRRKGKKKEGDAAPSPKKVARGKVPEGAG